jgi:thiamine pyrophosphokinase
VVVVSGGGPPAADAAADLPADAYVIAADSGLDHALALGLHVDLAVGDMDSVTPAALAATTAAIDRHPRAKDQTDLELALDHALALAPTRIVVLGPDGGRLDHLLASTLLLAHPRYKSVPIEARLGPTRVTVIHNAAVLHGKPGDTVTLLPLHGPALGVTTTGLLYPLQNEDLPPGTTRGVSNELQTPPARVELTAGTLLALQPAS